MHIVLGVPSGALEQGDAAIDVLVDGISNLLVFLGNDEELYRLPGTVDDVVARDASYERKGNTIDDDFGTVVKQVRRTDDGKVNELHGSPEAQTEFLVQPCHDDVGASRRTVVAEHNAQSGSTQNSTY